MGYYVDVIFVEGFLSTARLGSDLRPSIRERDTEREVGEEEHNKKFNSEGETRVENSCSHDSNERDRIHGKKVRRSEGRRRR